MFTVVTRMMPPLNMEETGRRSATRMGITVAAGHEDATSATPADEPPLLEGQPPLREGQAARHHELTVLATVAHELRGPLTALATSSELLAEDFLHLDPEQVKNMLGAMHRRTLWLQ